MEDKVVEFAYRRALPVTHRAVFTAVPSVDAASAVVRRLRAAIGLGLLADGERLPKEDELAHQLGVSNFALRDALYQLRQDGLVVTRPGKAGGSFVQHALSSAAMAESDLQEMSSAQLRDLGDWRRMVAVHAAGLAAQRASDSNLSRLTASAKALAAAPTADEARRAYCRFQIEVAAAAQSTRLSRAELAMHEELGWFLDLALPNAERRSECAAQLLGLTEAIRQQNVERARALAAQQVSDIVDGISRARIALLSKSSPSTAEATTVDGFASAAKSFADEVRNVLSDLADSGRNALLGPRRRLRSQVARASLATLEATKLPIHGLGIIAEVGLIQESPYWICWFERARGGGFTASNHVTDPSRDDFYDYESRDYFVQPRDLDVAWATGPYVDYNGVDDYIVTIATPIRDGGRFLGIAAADIFAAELERYFSPWLAGSHDLRLLLNAEGRVVVSNSLSYGMGELLRSTAGLVSKDVGAFGWVVITSAPAVGSSR
ncbi:GntR family transcriptional regulator [Mycolicibacterium sp.]|uniref:GntR family transcriptional regulator n=1 Tax=Mycolicibacterium sp. TaxID=2320850 RepID=UPI003D0FEA09